MLYNNLIIFKCCAPSQESWRPVILRTKADPGQSRANWSFDFAWSCTGCTVALTVTDNNNAANFVTFSPLTKTDIDAGNGTWLESWNLAVPEPASLALTGLALGALAFAQRRKA